MFGKKQKPDGAPTDNPFITVLPKPFRMTVWVHTKTMVDGTEHGKQSIDYGLVMAKNDDEALAKVRKFYEDQNQDGFAVAIEDMKSEAIGKGLLQTFHFFLS